MRLPNFRSLTTTCWRKDLSGILLISLVFSTSLLAFNVAVRNVEAEIDPWNMPVIYVNGYNPTPTTLQIQLAIYNLSDSYYTTNQEWHPGEPLGPHTTGPVTRYKYSLGNLYAFDISISWNPAVLSYLSRDTTVPRRNTPQPFGSEGILNDPVVMCSDTVDPVAGTYRIAYCSMGPWNSFNLPNDAASVFTMTFTVLSADDEGLSLDAATLVLDPMLWGRGYNIGVQPEIPWRSVMDPHLPHNVAVEGVLRNKAIVGQGYGFDTTVLLSNKGDSTETFNVSIYAGATTVGMTTASVPARSTRKVKVSCTTVGVTKGTYAIRVVVASVPDETYSGDNEMPSGIILVTLPGDVNGDRVVNIFDLVLIANCYGATDPNAPKYNPFVDLDNNYKVNLFDLVIAASNYGKSWV